VQLRRAARNLIGGGLFLLTWFSEDLGFLYEDTESLRKGRLTFIGDDDGVQEHYLFLC
jgi:hypothetical protein